MAISAICKIHGVSFKNNHCDFQLPFILFDEANQSFLTSKKLIFVQFFWTGVGGPTEFG